MIEIKDHNTVCHKSDKTLLESIEANKIEVHYHCREGYCGACRTTLLEGEVEYKSDPLAFIDDNEILPCCCFPTTDIKIELG
ncbi:class I ribonucleotide reductase maintenance protein YfaE [Paraglaciecola aquimarina]|uniref:Class I ribonucleotide reductase maintenance protein YfaE n=2 Tax=Paraglaciecola aquimarina TaxID=1235557 RepID=A0ABU3SY84_9ALTE|nr:class I ribonucleotide reductase maintenance protein YfaE [Paraglaciecola aquimarina]MDU0354970.1 class I ribonucleotide reductase maintenance protein YfaE [Paraglaciecola aquimarina]